jgi:hypothetical protein
MVWWLHANTSFNQGSLTSKSNKPGAGSVFPTMEMPAPALPWDGWMDATIVTNLSVCLPVYIPAIGNLCEVCMYVCM